MRLEDYNELLSEDERRELAGQVVGELFPHLPKRRKQDENK